jgi:hypothetical protein
MISEALSLLSAELKAYLDQFTDTDFTVALGNVKDGTDGQVLLSLVSMEEESALKNLSPYQRTPTGHDLVNPPLFLNLFVLVTPFASDYNTSLQRLARVVQCFQQKNQLTLATTPGYAAPTTTSFADLLRLRLSLDLYPLSFEKANQLWSILGISQRPSALYKVRVVEEQGAGKLGSGPSITTIDGRFGGTTPATPDSQSAA